MFAGGLKVRTTLDPDLQAAAEQAIVGRLAGVGPDAALVAIQNGTGEVRAMVGGSDFNARPFNLATNGHRQPGSAIKPFILARALDDGIDPNSVWASGPVSLPFVNGHGQKGTFDVSNYDDAYYGSSSLWSATAALGQLGVRAGGHEGEARQGRAPRPADGHPDQALHQPGHAARRAEGGRHAARDGVRLLHDRERRQEDLRLDGAEPDRPGGDPERRGRRRQGEDNKPNSVQVLPPKVAQVEKEMLRMVASAGTGKAAQVGTEDIWGKTGTTENYGDAWFVGETPT